MLDARLRPALAPGLQRAARGLSAAGVRAGWLTAAGWAAGVGACVAAGARLWQPALVLWLANRLLDGLDGPVARIVGSTELGGFVDIVADFSIYGGFVLGVAVGVPSARLACVALLVAYYCSGTAFLALSSLRERRGRPAGDERSLRFVGGLAEGTETVVAYAAMCLLPGHIAVISWVFAGAVAVTAGQRVWLGVRLLGRGGRTGDTHPTAPACSDAQRIGGR